MARLSDGAVHADSRLGARAKSLPLAGRLTAVLLIVSLSPSWVFLLATREKSPRRYSLSLNILASVERLGGLVQTPDWAWTSRAHSR